MLRQHFVSDQRSSSLHVGKKLWKKEEIFENKKPTAKVELAMP